MDISESYRRQFNFIKIVLITIVIIIGSNFTKVKAADNNFNIDINKNIYSTSNALSNKLIDNLITAITGKANGYEILLQGEMIGYTYSEVNINDIESILLENYIKDNNLKKESILSFEIKTDIDNIKGRIDLDLLSSTEEITSKIYDYINKNDLIKIKYKEIKLKNIKATTIIIPTDTLYSGESKIEEGKDGVVMQTNEVTLDNGKIIKEKIIDENIIEAQISKKIYRGTKNPYEDGIAFLNQPTRGGILTSEYGERWNSFHKGIDIAGDIGDDVIAAIDGYITYAEFNNGGYGNLIIIEHKDNMKTYYGHLSSFNVKVGDSVKKGDIIGEIGSTGFSTGPHLHFELRVDNNPVNPKNYIIK